MPTFDTATWSADNFPSEVSLVGNMFDANNPDRSGMAALRQALVRSKVDATSGATTMTRPLCKYPAYPRYRASGDPNLAASYSCSTL